MALDEVVFPEEGDRVEVEVERRARDREVIAQVLEPSAQQSDGGRAPEAIGVLREERGLGDDVEAGEEREASVEDEVRHMTLALDRRELHREGGEQRVDGRNRLGAGESGIDGESVEAEFDEERQEHEQAANAGLEGGGRELEATHVGAIGDLGAHGGRALVVPAAREPGKSFFAKHLGNRCGTELDVLFSEGVGDVVD